MRAGFSGADGDGLLLLAAALERTAVELHGTRAVISAAVTAGGVACDAPYTLGLLEGWCLDNAHDVLLRAGILAGGWWPGDWLVDKASTLVAGAELGRAAQLFEKGDRALGPLSVVANLHALAEPAHHGWRGWLDRGAAAVGVVGGATVLAAAAGTAPDWAVAAGIVSSAYAVGSFAYDERDVAQSALDALADEVVDAVDAAAGEFHDLFDTAGSGACDAWPVLLRISPALVDTIDPFRLCSRLAPSR